MGGQVGPKEDAGLAASVKAASGGFTGLEEEFCQVPWTEALDYVRGRKCFLKGGAAFILRSEMTALIAARFKGRLALALAVGFHSR